MLLADPLDHSLLHHCLVPTSGCSCLNVVVDAADPCIANNLRMERCCCNYLLLESDTSHVEMVTDMVFDAAFDQQCKLVQIDKAEVCLLILPYIRLLNDQEAHETRRIFSDCLLF